MKFCASKRPARPRTPVLDVGFLVVPTPNDTDVQGPVADALDD